MNESLPVAIIGAGPIGMAAASQLIDRDVRVRILEAGPNVGTNLRDWGHVRLFSVWDQCVDETAVHLLSKAGWKRPPGKELPTGNDIVEKYLEPLASLPAFQAALETDARVVRINREGLDRMSTRTREEKPFILTVANSDGTIREVQARAVIDTTGTWHNPNPIGAGGWPVPGEDDDRIAYGIPDISGVDRHDYAGKRVLVVGGGHSAANALLDLALLAETEPETKLIWAMRGVSLAKVFGGGEADQLPARGALGQRLRRLISTGRLEVVKSFSIRRIDRSSAGLTVEGVASGAVSTIGPVDRIVVATGQRPNFDFAGELQLDLHPVIESARLLGPLIDPNEHSCGSVPPHGWRELSHTEPGYFVAGIKSYGRAPTFLLLTGYEQVRSIAAHLAGDHAAADQVRLVLPETGICNATLGQVAPGGEAACCDGAKPDAADPCCDRPAAERKTTCCGSAKASRHESSKETVPA